MARQRDLADDSWGYLLPFVLGVTPALFGGGWAARSLTHTIAAIVVGVALFVGIAMWNAHTARRLRAAIMAIDAC